MVLQKKYWFNILFYSSFVFLLVALYKGDYFQIPKIKSYFLFSLSLFFLFLGFLLEAVAWKNLLHIKGYKVSSTSAIVASGLSVFTKYIPGKVMVVLSRSTYLNKTLDLPLKEIGVLSLFSQLLNLLTGCFIGLFCIQFWCLNPWFVVLFVACFAGLLLICFSSFFSLLLSLVFKKILKRELNISKVSFKEFFPISYWFILFWFSYSLGFWLLTASISENTLSSNPATLTLTSFPLRWLNLWMDWQISSFPTPVSPKIITGWDEGPMAST